MESKKSFSELLVALVMPCMVIDSYIMEFDREIFFNILRTLALSTLAIGLAMLIAFFVTRKDQSTDREIRWFALSFSNAGYMGFPLITALFGAEGLMYASAFVTIFNIMTWTIGYGRLNGNPRPSEMARSFLKQPVIWAVVIGLSIFCLEIPVPEVIARPIAYIGDMNTPIAMMITGIMIAGADLKGMLKDPKIWFNALFRMLLIPLISILIFYLLGFHGMVSKVVLLLAACPTAAITSVFAVRYSHNENFAAGAVVISTLCSIATLPVFALLISSLL